VCCLKAGLRNIIQSFQLLSRPEVVAVMVVIRILAFTAYFNSPQILKCCADIIKMMQLVILIKTINYSE